LPSKKASAGSHARKATGAFVSMSGLWKSYSQEPLGPPFHGSD
jgi:hypothetical protein